jgi:TAG lipase / steryl ester hydrolase / phospholipase A2 / LPA acyltransferase
MQRPIHGGRVRLLTLAPCAADVEFLKKRLRAMLSDVTFLDAYQRTSRFLNVTVTAADTNEPPRMLNYLTAPHVVIWSAVAASSAFPGLFPPQDILARDPAGNFVGCARCRCWC